MMHDIYLDTMAAFYNLKISSAMMQPYHADRRIVSLR